MGENASGGEPDSAPRYVKLSVRPQVGPEAVGGQRHVVIEPDAHPRREGALLHPRQLNIHIPLQPAVKKDLPLVRGRELSDGLALRIAVLFGPVGPDP